VVGPWDLAPLMRAVVDFSRVITDICIFGPLGERVEGGIKDVPGEIWKVSGKNVDEEDGGR